MQQKAAQEGCVWPYMLPAGTPQAESLSLKAQALASAPETFYDTSTLKG